MPTNDESSAGTDRYETPDWWCGTLHAVMMAVSVSIVVIYFADLIGEPSNQWLLQYLWLLPMPYIALGVYFDGRTLWGRYVVQ